MGFSGSGGGQAHGANDVPRQRTQRDNGSSMSGRPTPSISGTLQDLRAKATDFFREQMAILVLANHPERLSPQQISENVDAIHSMRSRKELKAWISKLRITVEQMRQKFGVRISREQTFAIMDWIHRTAGPNQACYMPAGMLGDYLTMYAEMKLPPHARVSLDPLCIGRDYPGGFEVRVLEASLFEDMCALFNQSQERFAAIPKTRPVGAIDLKIAAKRHAALMRATVSTAFYFVEAYINCLAADHVHKNGGQLSENDRMVLTEWDPSKNRHRLLSTRDKLVKYPRIITASAFPPIDENSCPELKYFVTTAKDFRDAIVHASASYDPVEAYPKKELLFAGLKQDEVGKIVDTAVALIEKIETLVSGRPQKWLRRRGENGFFPDEVFE
ncbi:MAG: hypothetical protein ABSB82_05230 [Terriglobia bacterium]